MTNAVDNGRFDRAVKILDAIIGQGSHSGPGYEDGLVAGMLDSLTGWFADESYHAFVWASPGFYGRSSYRCAKGKGTLTGLAPCRSPASPRTSCRRPIAPRTSPSQFLRFPCPIVAWQTIEAIASEATR